LLTEKLCADELHYHIGHLIGTVVGAIVGGLVGNAAGVKALSPRGSNSTVGMNGGRSMEGPVEVRAPPNATPEQIAQARAYCEGCNQAIEEGALSQSGRVNTKGKLRQEASRSANNERTRAAAEGTPYRGNAGHVPDTTWTGTPEPHSWLDLDPALNKSIDGQSNGHPFGYKPARFIYKP
jgi:toxin YxiD